MRTIVDKSVYLRIDWPHVDSLSTPDPIHPTRKEPPWKPVHRSLLSPAKPPSRRCAWPKTAGTRATRRAWRWPTREDTRWRNRAEFPVGRAAAQAFLERKWARELDYRLIKELWAFDGARIAVRFAYEWHDDSGHWFRSYGNENWEFNEAGLMTRRHASINDLPIEEASASSTGRWAAAPTTIRA